MVEEADLLVCGSCQVCFPLQDIMTFVQHKKYDCDTDGSVQKVLVCQSCTQKFSSPWSLLKHVQVEHELSLYTEWSPEPEPKPEPVQCCDDEECGVLVMPLTHEGLEKCCAQVVPKKRKRHMETKHNVKSVSHVYIDLEAGEYNSESGEPSFSYALAPPPAPSQDKSLKKRRYPTSRPYKCDQCEHSFNQRIHLKKHLSKHTGVKPYKCGQCDYSTVERSHLKVHIRVHTGEKPYKCSLCEYATAQNSTLKIHLKRHHNTEDTPSEAAARSGDLPYP